jgi:endonuclease YncB( thermonuclease family)
LTSLVGVTSASQTGYIVSYKDGDSFDVNIDGKVISVRLAGVDAPEICPHKSQVGGCYPQPYALAAKEEVMKLCSHPVRISTVLASDKYGRVVANVFCGNKDLATHLADLGLVYSLEPYTKKYRRDLYTNIQAAKKAGLGVYSINTLSTAASCRKDLNNC